MFGAAAHVEPIVGRTTTNALLSFDSATLTNASTRANITGLQSVRKRILSIDLRPTTGVLYGVSTTIGSLGFNGNGVAGFDIGASGFAFAALTDADTGKSGLHSISLATGAASFIGAFGISGNTAIGPPLLGLTMVTAPVPEPSNYALMLAGLMGMGWIARRRRTAR